MPNTDVWCVSGLFKRLQAWTQVGPALFEYAQPEIPIVWFQVPCRPISYLSDANLPTWFEIQ